MDIFELVHEGHIFVYRAQLGLLEANCYLIVNPEMRDVFIVDPGPELEDGNDFPDSWSL